jgi:hypothetical protein
MLLCTVLPCLRFYYACCIVPSCTADELQSWLRACNSDPALRSYLASTGASSNLPASLQDLQPHVVDALRETVALAQSHSTSRGGRGAADGRRSAQRSNKSAQQQVAQDLIGDAEGRSSVLTMNAGDGEGWWLQDYTHLDTVSDTDACVGHWVGGCLVQDLNECLTGCGVVDARAHKRAYLTVPGSNKSLDLNCTAEQRTHYHKTVDQTCQHHATSSVCASTYSLRPMLCLCCPVPILVCCSCCHASAVCWVTACSLRSHVLLQGGERHGVRKPTSSTSATSSQHAMAAAVEAAAAAAVAARAMKLSAGVPSGCCLMKDTMACQQLTWCHQVPLLLLLLLVLSQLTHQRA